MRSLRAMDRETARIFKGGMWLGALALLVLASLALVACNGDEEDAKASSPAAETPAKEAEPTPEGEAVEIKRGCPACHALSEPDTGKYTLGYEAHERSKARGATHPEVSPDGTAIGPTDNPNVSVCLTCHAAATGDREGKGRAAPLSLRDILHPSHLNSGHFDGNCFSCHNVSGEGVWQLLSEPVEINEKGVPDPDQLPIPGLLNPSE